jgi:DNA/RNA endonuclease YhcR with UshA esterase domain
MSESRHAYAELEGKLFVVTFVTFVTFISSIQLWMSLEPQHAIERERVHREEGDGVLASTPEVIRIG